MSLKVVILGAGGLVGSRLTQRICGLKEMNVEQTTMSLDKIVLFDLNEPKLPDWIRADKRVRVALGDLTDEATIKAVLDPEGCTNVTTIHLAAVLSGYAEKDFDLGLKVNLYGTLNVMQRVRELGVTLGRPQIYVFTSTDYVTCFNQRNKEVPCNEESFRLSPVSYGCQKACIELMVSDFSRKGFINGRVARISAVVGRPGWSNSISYPYTGIFTQPLEGKDYGVPLPMDIPYPCSSLLTNIEGFLYLASSLEGSKIDAYHGPGIVNRVVQLPARSFTLNEIWAACQEVAKEEGVENFGSIHAVDASQGDTTVKEINVCPRVSCDKARALGFPMNVDMKEIIRDYVNTYIKK